ncbi:alpha/beta fold hydrolase [Winogradskyella bathintestinalis]|jgi:pimeloyl-ACP methyl ester carboxylesterase|uniref:Alpha/beta hydrolase n=1 Tax=Winogradskyella bathintestinalis TaxID=3035208 RepID=A0ABT7ZUW1_9FLAO|nr:alpha/beta hydrolase [Winogradskyella bathintestinalis]MDN3492772.1 alpha/beta hydrolase [Winogradskyella bathintestinalis]
MFFKSQEGKSKILSLYNQKLNELNIEYSEKLIQNQFGATNVIITGDTKNPPLVLIHGTGGCAPQILDSFPNLSSKYCVYAVDVLAQPTKSAENRLDMKSLDYGKWLVEVIQKLDLTAVTLVGFSFGGFISLKTLEFDETLIKKAYLIAPVYIVNGNPFTGLFKMFMPLKKFTKTNKSKYLKKVMNVLFSEADDFAFQFMGTTFQNCNMDFSPLPVISKNSAKEINTPITIFASEKDILFPGKKMVKRAERVFPTLSETVLLEGSKHVPNAKNFKKIEDLIIDKN